MLKYTVQRTYTIPKESIRHLDITDEERIQRFRTAGYGGNVSDSLWRLGVKDTVLSSRFIALRQGMQLVGRALPVKLHSYVHDEEMMLDPVAWDKYTAEEYKEQGGHPQKRMMRRVAEKANGTVLCFDCGGDMQPAHFGEMSCQLAKSHGCRGMLIAGNCRDTQYVLKMDDFPIYSFGRTPNAFGGWMVTDVDVPIMLPGHLTHYVRVYPDDFIFGDNDGVQVIPGEIVDEVLLMAEAVYERENHERELIASGVPIDEVFTEFGIL